MKDDVNQMCCALGLPEIAATTTTHSLATVEGTRTRADIHVQNSWNIPFIVSVLTNILGFVFLGCYLASLSACDRDMGSMLLPLQPSWAANGSAVSWSCVGEVADCSSLRTKLQTAVRDRDTLLQHNQNLTATMNALRKEYQASNVALEKQLQLVEGRHSSTVRQLRDEFQASNTSFEKQIRSLEMEKISLETIQTGLRKKVELVEEQRDSNARQLKALLDEVGRGRSSDAMGSIPSSSTTMIAGDAEEERDLVVGLLPPRSKAAAQKTAQSGWSQLSV